MANDVKINISAIDKFSSVIQKASKKFNGLSKSAKKANAAFARMQKTTRGIRDSLNGIGKKSTETGKKMSLGLTAPIAGLGALVLNANKDFQTAFNKVEAKAEESGVTFEKLQKQAMKLGSTTQFSATQAADSMAFLAQAGFKTNDIFKTTPAVLDLAAASGEDLAFTADILSNTMGAFKIEAEESSRVADVMAATLGGSNVNLQQFADTMKFVAPVASDFGASLEDTSAAVGFLGNIGIQGSNAATALKSAFLGLSAPTSAASKVLKQAGVEVSDAQGNMKPFTTILQDMAERMQDLPQDARINVLNKVFGKRGIAGASELLKQTISGNNNQLEKFAEKLKNSEGAASKMAITMQKGLPGAINKVKSAFEGMLLSIGFNGGINEMFEVMAEKIAKVFRWIGQLSPTVLKWSAIVAGVVAVMGPMLVAFGFMAQGIVGIIALAGPLAAIMSTVGSVLGVVAGALSAPVVAIGALIAGIARLIVKWSELKKAFSTGGIGAAASKFFDFIPGIGGDDDGGGAKKANTAGINTSKINQAGANNTVQTNNAKVGIDIAGLPKGSKVTNEGVSDLSVAFSGIEGF